MLDILRHIVKEVCSASNLDEAVVIIVGRVKQALGVDVCSIYLIDHATDHYVLMATDGLKADSVGRVHMGRNEGLVGLVGERQEPVNLGNASAHPRYLYIPETAEERYRGFLGVPIIHYRQVMGVLVVQRRDECLFDADESAFLFTLAAQLAGVINHAVMDGSISRLLSGRTRVPGFMQGIPGASGIALGAIAVVFPAAKLEAIPDREIRDVDAEERRFRTAVTQVREEIRAGSARMSTVLPAEEQALFDVYMLLLGNDSLVSETVQRIRAGNWAPGALRDTIAEHARVFDQMEDPYLRVRAEDIRDIGRRIVLYLQSEAVEQREYPQRCILLSDQVSIAQIAEVPIDQLAGIVCRKGSNLSHTAILARALGIPAVMGLSDFSARRLDGREIIVDGYQGRVYIQPSDIVRDEYRRLAEAEAKLAAGLEELRDKPAETPDGARVALYVNTGLLSDIPPALNRGAEGVGLYRTEFAFMVRNSFPGEEEQYRTYRKALMLFAPKPVIMRTLDVGGDKALPYFSVKEDNPFLGWRGIRVTLDHPEIFLPQLRAMLKANAGLNNLRVLLPMISKVREVDEAIALLEQAHRELLEEGKASTKPLLGVMVETPAVVYQIEALARRVDFFSIGTNDLTQYLLGVDRNNARVATLYDNLHPAVIHAVNEVTQKVHRWGKPVSVCGEMAGDPAAALLLMGMGIETLSMGAPALARIKRLIRSFTRHHARQLLDEALGMEDASDVRRLLTDALEQAGLGGLVRAGK